MYSRRHFTQVEDFKALISLINYFSTSLPDDICDNSSVALKEYCIHLWMLFTEMLVIIYLFLFPMYKKPCLPKKDLVSVIQYSILFHALARAILQFLLLPYICFQ